MHACTYATRSSHSINHPSEQPPSPPPKTNKQTTPTKNKQTTKNKTNQQNKQNTPQADPTRPLDPSTLLWQREVEGGFHTMLVKLYPMLKEVSE